MRRRVTSTLRPSCPPSTTMHSCVDRHASVDLAFIADAAAKMLKMQHILAYNGLPPRDLRF